MKLLVRGFEQIHPETGGVLFPQKLPLRQPPPEGPNSGVLVIQDEEAVPTFCCGFFKSDRVSWGLPFPQNKNLTVRYTQQTGEHQDVDTNRVLFIPVLNQPLSSNQYYVVERKGKHKGYVCALSPTSPCFVFLLLFFSYPLYL